MHSFLRCSVTLILVAVITPGIASAATKNTGTHARSILMRIAEEQLFEVSLGQLASQRARNHQTKELAALVVEDHEKARRQLEQLALKEGISLPPELGQDDRRMIEQLSQLSGNAFDGEYVKHLLQGHEKTVKALEQQVATIQNEPLRHWMITTIPLLEFHRISARLLETARKPNP